MFTAIPDTPQIVFHNMMIGSGSAVYATMWCPALAALATCAICGIDAASLGWSWRPSRFVAIGYVLPLLYAVPVYVIAWVAIPGSFHYDDFVANATKMWGIQQSQSLVALTLMLPSVAGISVIRTLAVTLGEEMGWRGFLLPRLIASRGYGLGCLVGGLIWAAWHMPAILWAGYESGTPKPYAIACFTVTMVATTFIMGWLRLRSRSVWPCAMLHATHNIFIQVVLDPLTVSDGVAPYITTEFGLGLSLSTVSTALIIAVVQRSRLFGAEGRLAQADISNLRSGISSP